MPLKLEIVTPEAKVYSDTVESVVIPTTSGEIGIMPGHIPIVTVLEAGELQVQTASGRQSLAVSKGFVQCVGDKVSILAEAAIDVAEINEQAVEEGQRRAEEELKKMGDMTQEEIELLETSIQFAKKQLLVKRKIR